MHGMAGGLCRGCGRPPAAKSRPRRRYLPRRAALCGIRSVQGGDITPRPRRRIRGRARLRSAHSPGAQAGRVQAGLFVRAIPVFPPSFRRPCLQRAAFRGTARLPHGKRMAKPAGCPTVLWREQPVSLRHFYVNEIACGSAVAVFRIPACCYFIDISARLEGENISIDGRPFAVCGRLSPIFIAPAFHAENGIGFLCKSQRSRCFQCFMRRGQ